MPPHVIQFFTRLDNVLKGLSSNTKIRLLETQRDSWETLFAAYARKLDRGEDTSADVRADDYIVTITGLDQRLADARREGANWRPHRANQSP